MIMKVAVVGTDGSNTTGIIQCLGLSGFSVIVYLFGTNSGLCASSRFVNHIYLCGDIDDCIKKMIADGINRKNKTPAIACSDIVASQFDKYKNSLSSYYLFEHTYLNFSINDILDKPFQLEMAEQCGFNIPMHYKSATYDGGGIKFPCIIKPQVSKNGAKSDLRVCSSLEEYQNNINTLKHTTEYIVEQYIDRDYEISILGCAKKDGDCIIPTVENKLTLFPLYVGLECLAKVEELTDTELIKCVKQFINRIGYVGLFSIEMMHSKVDGKFYFTEINPRNDGANSFIYKYGVNLPLVHINDLLDVEYDWNKYKKHPGYYIWDLHHLKSFLHHDIGFKQWISELFKSKGLLMFFIRDPKPFFKQYLNWMKRKW